MPSDTFIHCFGIVGAVSIITHGATLVMLDVFDPLMC